MSLDRSWSKDISDEEFFHEYQRRFPWADVIPGREEYLNGSEPEYHGITDIDPEKIVVDSVVKNEGESVEKPKEVKRYKCRGCGRDDFSFPIAKTAHERHCKMLKKEVA